jgi:hypothetical protein
MNSMKIIKLIALSALISVEVLAGNVVFAKEKLPFIGMRWFNIYGGSGTGQSITIEKNGRTTIRVHGTVSTGIMYEGKFSNPIAINEGGEIHKYLLRNNKIYGLGKNGVILRGCWPSKSPLCESELRP